MKALLVGTNGSVHECSQFMWDIEKDASKSRLVDWVFFSIIPRSGCGRIIRNKIIKSSDRVKYDSVMYFENFEEEIVLNEEATRLYRKFSDEHYQNRVICGNAIFLDKEFTFMIELGLVNCRHYESYDDPTMHFWTLR